MRLECKGQKVQNGKYKRRIGRGGEERQWVIEVAVGRGFVELMQNRGGVGQAG